jgi:hypothetical protein
MNQIVHIFRKDCRRLWKVIIAVLAFTVLHAYGELIASAGASRAIGLSPYAVFLMLVGLSYILLPVALFLLVVSVIQEESLVGTDQFWLTRPYSRRSLALEKSLFVLLFAFLPMLAHDVWLVRHFAFSLSAASGPLFWKEAQFTFFLLVAGAFAVLSSGLARAVLVAIAAIFCAIFIFLFVLQNGGPPSEATPVILAILALAAIGAVCVIVFQYRFRITPVAVLIGVVAILACALLGRFWPASMSAYISNQSASPLLQSIQLVPDAGLKDLTRPLPNESSRIQDRTVYYPFRAIGLPGDIAMLLNGVSAKFSSPGIKQTNFYIAQQARFQMPADSRSFAEAGSPDQLVPFMVAFLDDPAPLKTAEGTLSGKLYLEGFDSSVARMPVPLPYQPQRFDIAGRHCSVEAGQQQGKLVLRFDCVELEPGSTMRVQVHLLQNNQEIVYQGSSGETYTQSGWPGFLSPILRTGFSFDFSPQVSTDVLASGSPQGREMLVFAEKSLGRQERDFRIEQFRTADLTLSAWQQRGALLATPQNPVPAAPPPRSE